MGKVLVKVLPILLIKSIGIDIGNIFIWKYSYRYWQYFYMKVLVSILVIQFKSIIVNPNTWPQFYGVYYCLSMSDITDVSTIRHSFKTDNCRTPSFHVAQYGDDIIGRELNLDENGPLSTVVVEPLPAQYSGSGIPARSVQW